MNNIQIKQDDGQYLQNENDFMLAQIRKRNHEEYSKAGLSEELFITNSSLFGRAFTALRVDRYPLPYLIFFGGLGIWKGWHPFLLINGLICVFLATNVSKVKDAKIVDLSYIVWIASYVSCYYQASVNESGVILLLFNSLLLAFLADRKLPASLYKAGGSDESVEMAHLYGVGAVIMFLESIVIAIVSILV